MFNLSYEEKELIVFGLTMRKNYIETGDIVLSAQDAKNMGCSEKIKPFSEESFELFHKLNLLIKKIQNFG